MNPIIFLGTNDFAANILEKLIKKKIKISHTLTKPDNKFGRGLKITEYPVKVISKKYSIPCLQIENINSIESSKLIKSLNPNLILMIEYGVKIKKNIIKIPNVGILNLHPSILPDLKGPTPIQTAILNGYTETGVSVIKINNKIDSGNILNIIKCKLNKNETYITLQKKLIILSVKCIINTLALLKKNKIIEIIQDPKKSSYTQKIDKDYFKIDWEDKAINIERKIRSLTGFKYPFTTFKEEKIKVIYVKIIKKNIKSNPGTIIKINNNGVDVKTSDYLIRIKKLQFHGKNIITIKDMLNSKKSFFNIGETFN